MAETFDLIVKGGACVSPSGVSVLDIGIRDGRIVAIGDEVRGAAVEVIEARGLHVLPGVIDTHVHFREPGLTHKEDLATGTACAVLGGVTSIFEMPNTAPPTVSAQTLADKVARAAGRAFCDFAFYAAADGANTAELAALEASPGCCGIKVFMGSSTGSLLVSDDQAIRAVLKATRRRVAFHSEDDARLEERKARYAIRGRPESHPAWRDTEAALFSTRRLVALAAETNRLVHVLHVTTAQELDLLAKHRERATVEVTPQHLTLTAPECYDELGTRAQMNPPIREVSHRDALWRAVAQGTVDIIGSDHAPHTLEEKARPYPDSPSGLPGVQTLLPLLLDHVAQGRLTLPHLVDLTSTNPARIFGIEGKGRIEVGADADLALVDLNRRQVITKDWLRSRCGWSPFEGREVQGWPVATVLRGQLVMRDGELIGEPAGQPLRFTP